MSNAGVWEVGRTLIALFCLIYSVRCLFDVHRDYAVAARDAGLVSFVMAQGAIRIEDNRMLIILAVFVANLVSLFYPQVYAPQTRITNTALFIVTVLTAVNARDDSHKRQLLRKMVSVDNTVAVTTVTMSSPTDPKG